MHSTTIALAVLGVGALLASGADAQDYLLLTGYSDSNGPSAPTDNSYPVSRFRDLDGDGTINDATELFAFLKRSFNTRYMNGGEYVSFMSDMDWVQEGDHYAFYLTDSADGRVVRGVDSNHNGVLDNNEVTEFFDFQSGFAPDGVAVYRDQASGQTRVYVAMDDSGSPYGQGIHRLVDLNGDGDAKDAGEQIALVSAAANLSVTGTGGSNVPLVSQLWERIHMLPDGTLIAFSRGLTTATATPTPDQFCWYAFTDNNGTATASVFFNPSQLNGIDTWPDFAPGGQFPQWDAVFSAGNTWNGVHLFAAAPPNAIGLRDYYFTADYDPANWAYTNPNGINVHGLVYRWRDLNQNYRIDTGEISLFANFSGQPVAGVQPFTVLDGQTTVGQLNQRIFSMKAADGKLEICWEPNLKFVMELDDANHNNVIDQGEARISYKYSAAANNVYSAAFGPYIKNFSAFSRGFMPGPFPAGLTPYGEGCPLSANGLSPVCEATGGAPQVGNAGFMVGVERLPANLPTAFTFVSLGRQTPPIALPAPPFSSGCDVLVDVGGGAFIGSFGPFASDADGVALAPVPIAADPSLAGFVLTFQWAVIEPGMSPRLVLSNGLEVTVQP